MKYVIVGDLHGNIPNIYYKDYDAIIAPGDFCSSDALRKFMFQAIREKMKDSDSKATWYDLVGRKKAKEMVKKSIKDGRKILEHLNSFGVPVYLIPGNTDWTKDTDTDWSFLKKTIMQIY